LYCSKLGFLTKFCHICARKAQGEKQSKKPQITFFLVNMVLTLQFSPQKYNTNLFFGLKSPISSLNAYANPSMAALLRHFFGG
jgi:hypothetical protein